MTKKYFREKGREFIALIAIIFLLILLYIFLELVFLLSKVSFISRMSEYIEVLLNSSFLLIIPVALLLSLVYFTCIGFSKKGKVINLIKQSLLFSFSFSFIFLIFSHLDTFIYTSFNKNITHLPLLIRISILLCLLSISLVFLKNYLISIFDFFSRKSKNIIIIFSVILILGIISLYQNLRDYNSFYAKPYKQSNEKPPNIIIFSSDGLDTERMSVYGATRDSTPNIREFAKSAIIFTKAYTNCYVTHGSIISILTGKLPITTGVLAQPDILIGKDSFEHLPAILRKVGYYCADFGPYHKYGFTIANMLAGFDEINGVKTYLYSHNLLDKLIKPYPIETYFLCSLFLNRVYIKLASLCGISNVSSVNIIDIDNPLTKSGLPSEQMIDRAIKIINKVNKPIFIHIHLLDTHLKCIPNPKIRNFSYGKEYIRDDNDFYDDALLYMDNLFGKLLNALMQNNKYDKTIILFQTDHGRHIASGTLQTPLPLIIRFPNISDIYSCDYPVQYLDIAPSILKAININIPDWMEGRAILYPLHNFKKEQIDSRPIISFSASFSYDNEKKAWLRAPIKPPLYGISEICMFKDKYFLKLSLGSEFRTNLFILEGVKHIPVNDENKRKEYLSILLEYLKEKNFKVDLGRNKLYFKR